MSEDRNHIDRDLFAQWEQENQIISQQQLTAKEMEKILQKASSGVSNSLVKNLGVDMALKSGMIIGFIVIIFLYLDNTFSIVTSMVFIAIASICIVLERQIQTGIKNLEQLHGNLIDSIHKQLDFYRSNLFSYPLLLSVSYAMFYTLGSMIYHALTYGFIKPFNDPVDVIVLTGIMVIGVVISISANLPYFKSRINNLEILLKDVGNEEGFRAKETEIKTKDMYRNVIFGIFLVLGLIALLYLIFTI